MSLRSTEHKQYTHFIAAHMDAYSRLVCNDFNVMARYRGVLVLISGTLCEVFILGIRLG